jgi:hypothetical protein
VVRPRVANVRGSDPKGFARPLGARIGGRGPGGVQLVLYEQDGHGEVGARPDEVPPGLLLGEQAEVGAHELEEAPAGCPREGAP